MMKVGMNVKSQKERFKEAVSELERLRDELFDEDKIDSKIFFRMGLLDQQLYEIFTTLYGKYA